MIVCSQEILLKACRILVPTKSMIRQRKMEEKAFTHQLSWYKREHLPPQGVNFIELFIFIFSSTGTDSNQVLRSHKLLWQEESFGTKVNGGVHLAPRKGTVLWGLPEVRRTHAELVVTVITKGEKVAKTGDRWGQKKLKCHIRSIWNKTKLLYSHLN